MANLFVHSYLKHIRSKLNVEAEFVLERLLEEGSATASQIIVAICSKATTTDTTNGEATSNQRLGMVGTWLLASWLLAR